MKEQKGMYDSEEEEEDIFGGNKNSRLSEILNKRNSVSYGQMKRIDVRTYSQIGERMQNVSQSNNQRKTIFDSDDNESDDDFIFRKKKNGKNGKDHQQGDIQKQQRLKELLEGE